MNELLQLAIDAHGGMERWNNFDKVGIHMLVNGVLWQAKGQEGVLDDSRIEIDLHHQGGRYLEFEGKQGQETNFSPEKVAILQEGRVVQELLNPRASFRDHVLETAWTRLQLIYFGTYAMWEYLTFPFNLTLPGFRTKELTPWQERGETWRRLLVLFPEDLAYHSRAQVFYFDTLGLLKRMDYDVDISGKVPAAQYVYDYHEVQGIQIPQRRLVYGRDKHCNAINEPLVVGINLLEIQFQ